MAGNSFFGNNHTIFLVSSFLKYFAFTYYIKTIDKSKSMVYNRCTGYIITDFRTIVNIYFAFP